MFEKKYEDQNGEILQKAIDALDYPFYIIDANNYEIIITNAVIGINLKSDKKYKCHKVTHRSGQPCSGKNDPCPIVEMKKTREPVVIEHTHFDKNGNKKDIEVHAYPIFNEKGKMAQIIEYSIDITEKKRIMHEIEKRSQELKEMNDLMMGRELKMVELKKEIARLNERK